MIEYDWTTFLKQWSEDILASSLGEKLKDKVSESGWLGLAPATDSQITQAEKRLKITLPPSYRAFLKVSNGWRQTTFAIERIWGTEEICWFRKKNREWIDAYSGPASFGPVEEQPDEEYFAYENTENYRYGQLKETLQISEEGDSAVYLLNPQVITKDGEWEAWFFANWIPGVVRYRSFLEMMQAEYHHFAHIDWKQPKGLIGELPDEYVGSPGSSKRRLKKKTKRREPMVLGRRLCEWTVDELVKMLEKTEYSKFREEIADILGMLGDPRAVDTLISMLRENSPASTSAIYAIKKLAPDRLTEPLLQLLRERHFCSFFAAAHVLSELGEERAVPILVEVLKDTRPKSVHQSEYIGQFIAQFHQSGFNALVELLKSDDSLIRRRAAVGLVYSYHPEVREQFLKLLNDPDPEIREISTTSLEIIPPKRKSGHR
ncbi:MAG: SMI1/KNR4 family protein [Pirellulales bacterium]|nr:SMI1/KNR4 family protein [Pirellulales bacterium]